VKDLFTDGSIRIGYDAIISSARQYAALTRAKELIKSTISALEAGLPADVASSDLELALSALSELDGRAVSESIVSSIFSHFCVGK
jgi:tRNA modification GTPase